MGEFAGCGAPPPPLPAGAHQGSSIEQLREEEEEEVTSACMVMGASVVPAENAADTRKAPLALRVEKEAFSPGGHMGKRRRKPSWLCSRAEFTASVAPNCSTPPPPTSG